MEPPSFDRNSQADIEARLLDAINGDRFDFLFTHSRYEHGEYSGEHANHVETRETVISLVDCGKVAKGRESVAYFAYDILYGGNGRATVAKKDPPYDAKYFLQLTYPELLKKCQWSMRAPDSATSLKNLGFPCPNPEGFECDNLALPQPFFIPKG